MGYDFDHSQYTQQAAQQQAQSQYQGMFGGGSSGVRLGNPPLNSQVFPTPGLSGFVETKRPEEVPESQLLLLLEEEGL
jgi:hypothetical protein